MQKLCERSVTDGQDEVETRRLQLMQGKLGLARTMLDQGRKMILVCEHVYSQNTVSSHDRASYRPAWHMSAIGLALDNVID